MAIEVSNNELVGSREFRRRAGKLLKKLGRGRGKKLVLTRHGAMVGVVISVPEYERLTDNNKEEGA